MFSAILANGAVHYKEALHRSLPRMSKDLNVIYITDVNEH